MELGSITATASGLPGRPIWPIRSSFRLTAGCLHNGNYSAKSKKQQLPLNCNCSVVL